MKILSDSNQKIGVQFDAEIRAAVQSIRRALSDAVTAAGGDPSRPQILARHLGLDKSLAWKIARIVTDDDVLAAIPRLPGRSGVRILCESLIAHGTGAPDIEALNAAFAAFDEAVARHAGSRGTLDMMVSSGSIEKQRERDEAHRRLSFQGNSATWGVQARVQLTFHMIAPAAGSDLLDTAVVAGLVDLRRLRADVAWAIAAADPVSGHAAGGTRSSLEPLDPALTPIHPAPLLTEFCTPGLPALRRAPGMHGATRFELGEGAVGSTGSATCLLGWITRASPAHAGSSGGHQVTLVTPCESMIFDFFVHRSLAFALRPRPGVHNQLAGGPMFPIDSPERTRLPILDTPVDLGEGPPDLTTIEVPRYAHLVELAARRLGHDLGQFHGFRYKLRYPPVPSIATWSYDATP